jgi:hypothetical protein
MLYVPTFSQISNVDKLTYYDASGTYFSANNRFGESVAISGNYIAVGAPLDHFDQNGEGSVYVFKNEFGKYIQKARLFPSDKNPDTLNRLKFGSSVSIADSGRYIITSAPGFIRIDGSGYVGAATGKVYGFRRSNEIWVDMNESEALPINSTLALDLTVDIGYIRRQRCPQLWK